jgi:hypothetical protein
MAVRCGLVGLIQPVRVDEREGDGQYSGAFMVVDDDDFYARRLGLFERIIGHRAAIDGDDQAAATSADFYERLPRRAVAFHQPVGDIMVCCQAKVTQ